MKLMFSSGSLHLYSYWYQIYKYNYKKWV